MVTSFEMTKNIYFDDVLNAVAILAKGSRTACF